MDSLDFLENSDFSFEISGNPDRIEILPFIDAESERSRTLIASFKVDSMEMIESARIPLLPGKNHVPFRQSVRIVKPLLWEPGRPFLYRFTVVFHQAGEPVFSIDKEAAIRFIDAVPGKYFRINGRELDLLPFEPDFYSDGQNLNGNLVRLTDSDPELEMKLDRCAQWGLVAALELTGSALPELFAGNPGIVFFTARSGSSGERLARGVSSSAVPFLSSSELNSLLNLN